MRCQVRILTETPLIGSRFFVVFLSLLKYMKCTWKQVTDTSFHTVSNFRCYIVCINDHVFEWNKLKPNNEPKNVLFTVILSNKSTWNSFDCPANFIVINCIIKYKISCSLRQPHIPTLDHGIHAEFSLGRPELHATERGETPCNYQNSPPILPLSSAPSSIIPDINVNFPNYHYYLQYLKLFLR